MNPATTILAAKAASDALEVVKESSQSFLNAVLHEAGEELGALLGDKIRARRYANLIQITARAQAQLQQAGLTARAVPLSIINPALDAASLEEEPDLQEIWANLLANAGDPRGDNPVEPPFPMMLRELNGRQIAFLDALYADAQTKAMELKRAVEVTSYRWDEIGNLFVNKVLLLLGLVDRSQTTEEAEKERILREALYHVDVFERLGILNQVLAPNTSALSMGYAFSRLGIKFIKACQPPKS